MKSGNRRQFVRHEWWVRFVIGIAVRSVITWRHLKLWLSLKTNLTLIAVGIFCSFCTKLFSFFVLVYENPVGSQFGVRQAKNCFRYHGRHKIYAGGIWKLTGVSLWKRIKCFPSTLRQMIHFCLVSTWNDGLFTSLFAAAILLFDLVPRVFFSRLREDPGSKISAFNCLGRRAKWKRERLCVPPLSSPVSRAHLGLRTNQLNAWMRIPDKEIYPLWEMTSFYAKMSKRSFFTWCHQN